MKAMVEKPGVVVVRGRGYLDGPRRVIVSSKDDGITLVANKAVVLSTGTRARMDPKVKGLIEAQPWTNRNATGAKKVRSQLWGTVLLHARWHMHIHRLELRLLCLAEITGYSAGMNHLLENGLWTSSNVEAYQYVPI